VFIYHASEARNVALIHQHVQRIIVRGKIVANPIRVTAGHAQHQA
jgi:hypothetical protein